MSNQPKLCEYFISSEVWSESSQLRVYDFAWVNVFHGESGGQGMGFRSSDFSVHWMYI